jgi:hypothetical protein
MSAQGDQIQRLSLKLEKRKDNFLTITEIGNNVNVNVLTFNF